VNCRRKPSSEETSFIMQLEKQVRIFQLCTGVLTVLVVVLLISGFQERRQKFQELDVERLNIVEPDGKLRMTISNKERVPDPILNGKTYAGARKGSRGAGILFFNDEGDECGGLSFSGKESGKTAQASGVLMFDQFHQDQTVGIAYSQSGDRKSAGLHVWDRPQTPASVWVDRIQAAERMPDGPQKQAEQDQIKQAAARGELGAHRVFVGKGTDGSAGVTIADRLGKNRIALIVDDKNTAHLQFMDESGKVVYTIPSDSPK
jgi:hypothetical protein